MPYFKENRGFKMKGFTPFTKKKPRRDYLDTGLKSGGGFFKRLKDEGVGSALLNTAPARWARTAGHGLKEGFKNFGRGY